MNIKWISNGNNRKMLFSEARKCFFREDSDPISETNEKLLQKNAEEEEAEILLKKQSITEAERKELEEIEKKTLNAKLKNRIKKYLEKKESSELLGFFRQDLRGEDPKAYGKKILKTSAKKVVQEANNVLTKAERRNPMRRYIQWLFQLSQESVFQKNVASFIRKYFNQELVKNLPDAKTKEMANFLMLWESSGEKDQKTKENREELLLQQELEEEILPTEKEKAREQTVLQWDQSLPKSLLEMVQNPQSSQKSFREVFQLLQKPPTERRAVAAEYLQKNICPETLEAIEKKYGKRSKKKLMHLSASYDREKIEETKKAAHGVNADVKEKEKSFSQSGENEEQNLQNEKKIETEIERVNTENAKILEQLKKAGFSEMVVQKAQEMSNAQKQEMSEEKSIHSEHERKRQKEFYMLVQTEIRNELSAVDKAEAGVMLKEIEKIEEKTQVFYEAVNNLFGEELLTLGEENETGKELIVKQAQALFDRAKHMCELAKNNNVEEIIQTLKGIELGEINDTKGQQNNRTLLFAFHKYLETQEEKRAEKNASYKEKRAMIWKFIKPYLENSERKTEAEIFEEAIGEEMEKIVEETQVLAADIQEGISEGNLPKKNTYPEIQQWAQDWGIPENEAINMVISAVPGSEIIFLDRPEIIRKTLHEYGKNDEEVVMLLEWYQKNSNGIAGRFAKQKGSLQKMLTEEAGEIALSGSSYIQKAYLDGKEGKVITREMQEEKYQNNKEKIENIREEVLPHVEKAKEVLREFTALEKRIPKTEEIKAKKGELFRLQKKLEGIVAWENASPENAPETSLMDRQSFLNDMAAIANFADEIQTTGNLGMAIEKGLESIETFTHEMSILDDQELAQKIQSPPSVDFTVKKEKRETLRDIREFNRKAKLDAFAYWVVSQDGFDSSCTFQEKNENGEETEKNISVRELIDSLENLNGKKVLQIIPDEQWKYGEEKAHIEMKSDIYTIFLKHSDIQRDENGKWIHENSDVLRYLRHEGYHALDIANGKVFGNELFEKIKNFERFREFKNDFLEATGSNENDFPQELFAFFLPDDKSILGLKKKYPEIADAIEEYNNENKNRFSERFSEKGVKQGFFTKKSEYAFTTAQINESELPNTLKKHHAFELQTQINRFLKNIKGVRESTAPSTGKEQFLESITADMEEEIAKTYTIGESDKKFKEVYDKMIALNDEVESALVRLSEVEEPESNFLSDILDNTTLLSLADIKLMWDTGVEFIERRYQRVSKARAGAAGKVIFDKIYPKLANEFDNKAEEAEKEEVNQYQEGLSNKDGWQIMERVTETNNKDELKACLNILSENGQIDWYDKRIWRALERVGCGIRFLDADANNTNVLKTKLQRACAALWDNDYFRGVDRANGSNFASKKSEYDEEIAANVQGMGSILGSLLNQKREGGNVDPQRYEAYVESCIEKGKSSPEEIFWYILQGVHHGILNMERINYLDANLLNVYPPIEWFYNKRPTLEEVRSLAERFPPDEKKGGGMPWGFLDWFMTEVFSNQNVRERIIKEASQGNWDHDWSTTLFAVGDVGTAEEMMRYSEGKPRLQPTAYPNMLIGQMAYITSMARYSDRYSKDALKDEVLRHLQFTTAYDTIAMGNVTQDSMGQGYHRISDYSLKKPPRRKATEQLYQSKKDLTALELINNNLDIVMMIDPEGRLEFLRNNFEDEKSIETFEQNFANLRDKNTGKPVLEGERIHNATDILNALPKVFKALLDNHPERLDMILQKSLDIYAEDHPDAPPDNPYNRNRINDERAIHWREYAKREDSVGEYILNNFGMYNR